MSYQSASRTELSKTRGVFSGGYCDNVDNLDLADYYSPYLRNCRLDGQDIVIRPGHSLFETLTTGSYPKGIGTYLRALEANDVLVVRHNTDATHKLVTITEGGTAVSISTGTDIQSDNRMFFQSVGDVIYCMNGADKFGKLNGTTYSLPSTVPTGTGIAAQTTIAFVDSNPDTITDSGNGFLTAGFIAGQRITVTGSVSNNTTFTIATVTAGTITLIAADTVVAEAAGNSITITKQFAPAYSVSFAGSHWAAGRPANPNKVYKSVSGNFEDFTNTGATNYTFRESMTGLSANSQALFYFTKNTISITGIGDITDTAGTLTFTTRVLQAKEGATNHHSIVSVGINTYFLTPSNKICSIAQGTNNDGFEVVDLSHRPYRGIDKLMATLDDDQSASFAYYLPAQNLIKRHVKTVGAGFNDLCLVYDLTKDAWLVDNQKYFYGGVVFHNVAYTISMIEPKVFIDEYGPDDEGDEGVGIPFEYWTKKFYISKPPNRKKCLRESRTTLDMSELAEPTQEIYMDDVIRDTKTLTSADIPSAPSADPIAVIAIGTGGDYDSDDYEPVEILRTKGNLNKKGKNIQFRYTNGTLAGKVRLKDVAILVEVLPGLASNLT